jgi:hypothetical protein
MKGSRNRLVGRLGAASIDRSYSMDLLDPAEEIFTN